MGAAIKWKKKKLEPCLEKSKNQPSLAIITRKIIMLVLTSLLSWLWVY